MPDLGSVTFDDVQGVVTPGTVPVVEDVDNPGNVDADVQFVVGQRSRLTYRGFFASSPMATLWAMVGGEALDADDETGSTYSVKVCAMVPTSRIALCRGVLGRFYTIAVEVKPWA